MLIYEITQLQVLIFLPRGSAHISFAVIFTVFVLMGLETYVCAGVLCSVSGLSGDAATAPAQVYVGMGLLAASTVTYVLCH